MKKIFLILILAALCAGAVFADEKTPVYLNYPSRTGYIKLDNVRRIVINPKKEKIYFFSSEKCDAGNFSWSLMDEDGEVYEYSFVSQGMINEYGRDWYASLLVNDYSEVLNLLSEKNAFNAVFKDNEDSRIKYNYSMSYDNEWLKHSVHLILNAEYFRGDKGPAGGTILYDCGADDDIGNGDGMLAYEKGWRYIEFADRYIHLIGKKPSCDAENDFYSKAKSEFQFLPEMDVSLSTSASLFEGKENTDKILEAFKAMASKNNQNYPISACAAKLCDELEYNGFDDWYLPSCDEVYYVEEWLGPEALPNHDISSDIWTSTYVDGEAYYFCYRPNFPRNGYYHFSKKPTQDISTMKSILPFRRF